MPQPGYGPDEHGGTAESSFQMTKLLRNLPKSSCKSAIIPQEYKPERNI